MLSDFPRPRAATRVGHQLARQEVGDLALELVDRLGEFAQPSQLIARDPDAHRLLRAG
jgi:hypothetical protein